MKSIKQILKFDFSNLRGDLSGGLTAAIIAIPMGLAFGIQSGLGAQAGLYTAILLAILAALVGGTQTLISDPTGPMTVVAATVVGGAVAFAGDLETALPLIIGTFVLAALIQMLFGFLKVANYIKYMPYPVISGFMGGIGFIIIILQIFPLMGLTSPKGIFNILSGISDGVANLNSNAFLLGGLTIGLIYLIPMISRKIPAILIALVITTVLSVVMHMDVPVIGSIPTGLPEFQISRLFDLSLLDLDMIVGPAITLAALGTLDTLLTSVVADNITKTRHNGNLELIGQGLGNVFSALFGGIPGAGATMGTVTNINSGARTKLSGISKGVFMATILIGLGQYVQFVPMSVLAGVLVTIGIGIIDVKGLKILLKVPKSDSFILVTVLLVTVFDNLLDAVGVGMVLATFLFMKRMSDSVGESNKTGGLTGLVNIKLPAHIEEIVYLKRLEGPLFFGFTDQFKSHAETIGDVYRYVVIDMKRVPFLDETGILTLEEVIRLLENKGKEVYLVGPNTGIRDQLKRVGIIPEVIKSEECFSSMGKCLSFLEDHYNSSHMAQKAG